MKEVIFNRAKSRDVGNSSGYFRNKIYAGKMKQTIVVDFKENPIKGVSMDCYIVYFCTGEFSDYHEYVLEIFASQESANKFAESFRKRLDGIGYHNEGDCRSIDDEDTRYNGEIDGMIIDYNGASISVAGPYRFNS